GSAGGPRGAHQRGLGFTDKAVTVAVDAAGAVYLGGYSQNGPETSWIDFNPDPAQVAWKEVVTFEARAAQAASSPSASGGRSAPAGKPPPPPARAATARRRCGAGRPARPSAWAGPSGAGHLDRPARPAAGRRRSPSPRPGRARHAAPGPALPPPYSTRSPYCTS